jgi:hypothetical protein
MAWNVALVPGYDIVRGIISEAKTVPNVATSLVLAWGVLWAGAWYGSQHLIPIVDAHDAKIVEISRQMHTVIVDLLSVGDSVERGQIENKEERLFDARVEQCKAATPEARGFFGEKVQSLMREYEELTGQQYALPACSEIQ